MKSMKTAFVMSALLIPGLALASGPAMVYGGALDPVSGSIALGLGGLALWKSRKTAAAAKEA
jgi:hypothetical protein